MREELPGMERVKGEPSQVSLKGEKASQPFLATARGMKSEKVKEVKSKKELSGYYPLPTSNHRGE